MKLYHGSHNNNVQFNKDAHFGLYGNALFFTNSETKSKNYGEFIYSVEVDDDSILTQQDLWYNLDSDVVMNALLQAIADEHLNVEDVDRIYELVIDDENVNRTAIDAEVLCSDEDPAYICWKAQKIRVSVAEKLGYKAVEMNDENGISYAVISPVLSKEFE